MSNAFLRIGTWTLSLWGLQEFIPQLTQYLDPFGMLTVHNLVPLEEERTPHMASLRQQCLIHSTSIY